jgi:hypothetical protein
MMVWWWFEAATVNSTSISQRCAATARQYTNALFVASSGRSKNSRCVQRLVSM